MDMPQWFKDTSARYQNGMNGLMPEWMRQNKDQTLRGVMMQQPHVNSQPYAPGSLGRQPIAADPGYSGAPGALIEGAGRDAGQSPLGFTTGGTIGVDSPQPPRESVVEQIARAQRPAGTIAGSLGPSTQHGVNPTHPAMPSAADWATAGKPAEGGREIGPASWMDKLSVFDKGSLMGSLFGYRNAKPAPGSPAEPTGMLPLLYRNFLG